MKTVRAWAVVRDDGNFILEDVRQSKQMAELLADVLNTELAPKVHDYRVVHVEIQEVSDENG